MSETVSFAFNLPHWVVIMLAVAAFLGGCGALLEGISILIRARLGDGDDPL